MNKEFLRTQTDIEIEKEKRARSNETKGTFISILGVLTGYKIAEYLGSKETEFPFWIYSVLCVLCFLYVALFLFVGFYIANKDD